MKTTRALISVIIPVYNGASFIAEAVASIRLQGYPALEIIVSDDGSTDDTASIVANLPGDICYLYQANSGPAAARNRGLEKSRGDLISFLDVDDLWPTNKLSLQLATLAENPSVDLVMGLTQMVQASTHAESVPALWPVYPPRLAFYLGSAVMRRGVFDRVGLFDETLRYSEDVDWFLRARECAVPFLVTSDVVLLYRLHDRNMTRGKSAVDLNILKTLKRSLERRREKPGAEATQLPKLSASDRETRCKR